ncbi:Long-chain-fatty-acid--CoA ligase 1 [Acipenser ruthenus]|uniref:long-chain-fatty-acid--CoA ligase n=1 Tax=Acipenser ruthenus TaxID=7906 RepID=A0A444U6K4_ACIRT|nr:Long-chain-fatty-acid--CoA ligase 1 [Acipenser ruthenus]
MQAHELLRQLRLPEFGEVRQYVRTLPTNTLMGFGAFAALTTYWYATRPKALKPPCDLALQSVEIEGGDYARRSVLLESDQSLAFYYNDAKTMYDIFQRGMRISNNGPCLGSRKPNQPYEWMCYQEWTIAELACYTYSMVSVPLYDTLGAEAIAYIIEKAEISTVICDTPEKAQLLLECASKGVHRMKTIILMDAFDIDLVGQAKKLGIEIISLRELETSYCINSSDTHVSYLPLAHMFERLVQIFGQANTPLKRWLLDFATKRKEAELKSGIVRNDSVWDKLIFSKVQASLGGKVRLMVTGAAPVSPAVLSFLRAALGCQVCIKGPNVFKGYLKDPEKTAEALDEDGWLHTGDIGKWLLNGTLKIIDRKKHIFKMAQGEYIAPEKIENIYIRSDPVAQVFVHGDSLQACLVAITVPDPEVLPSWAKKRGFEGSFTELCSNKIKDIALHPEMFSIQNGLLTPTLKTKRGDLRNYFREQIDGLYSNIKM